MAQATLHQILVQLKTLQPEELRQVGEAVQEQLAPQEEALKREAFHRALLASGLVKEIKKPRPGVRPERRLVEVQGKPVSETIIEERR
jgi:hypothetical protein